MNKNALHQHISAPVGRIEPNAPLLNIPPDGQLLYKVMTVENLLRSIAGNYLHFTRIDGFADFPGADLNDGRQLQEDQHSNERMSFEKAPDFSAADYYDQTRARTYACCFSLENSGFIWNNYANAYSSKGKVCIVFDFGAIRAKINRTLQPGDAAIEYSGKQCHQIFSVNYGVVEYVEWENHQANTEHYPNQIRYTYFKDKQKYGEEKELRISLSALSIGQFILKDGSTMQLPKNLQLAFDFRSAIADQTIQQILCPPGYDSGYLQEELHKLDIVLSKG